MGGPEVPAVEKLVGRSGIPVIPEVGERLLDGPGTAYLQRIDFERLEALPLTIRPVQWVLQPQISCLCERLLALGFQGAMLGASHQINRLVQFLRAVELVMYDQGLRSRYAGGLQIRHPHVHGHGIDRLALRLRNRCPERICGFSSAFGHHLKHSSALDVVQHRNIIMTLAEALLIEAGIAQPFQRSPCHAACDCPLHHPIHLVPRERRQPLGLHLAAHGLQHLNGIGFKEFGKATPVLGPGDWDLFDPTLQTVDPRDVGLNEGLPLHRIEMTPASRTGIVTWYHGLTLRAVQRHVWRPPHAHRNLAQRCLA